MNYRLLAPVSGAIAVVLFVLAVLIVETGEQSGEDASGAELAVYLHDNLNRLALAALVWGIGSILFVTFLDGLRARISSGSDQLGRVSFALGLAATIFLLASWLPEAAGALASREELSRELEPGAADAFTFLGEGFFFGGELMLAGLLLCTGLAVVKTRVLPAWLGWISLVLGVVALVPPIGWAVVVFAFPLWILVTSTLLWRRPSGVPARA